MSAGARRATERGDGQDVLTGIARWCFARRRITLAVWILAILLLGGVMRTVGTAYETDFTLPDVESARGVDLLEEDFGGRGAGSVANIVFVAPRGVDTPEVRRAMTDFFAEVADIEGVMGVQSPYEEGGSQQISRRGDRAGQIAYAVVQADPDATVEDTTAIGDEILDARPQVDQLRIELGGADFAGFEAPSSEILGLGFAIVILILAFGSVVAMGLPIGVALAGIASGSLVGGLVSNLVTTPDFASTIGIMIGLGVGIDYALLIVTRFRENLHDGHDIERSMLVAMDTAGRSVLFAGITVVISLLGMLIMQLGFVSGLAIAAAVVVAMTVVSSFTLLPALLGFIGERIEVTRRRGLVAAGLVAIALIGVGIKVPALPIVALPLAVIVLAASFAVAPLRARVLQRERPPRRETLAYRWSRVIQHRPWRSAFAGVALLILLAVPLLGLRLGFADEGTYPTDTTTRQAYDLLADGFGPGYNGPLILVSETPDGAGSARLDQISTTLGNVDGVAGVSPAMPNDPSDPTAVMWQVIPTTSPQSQATTELVDRIREDVLPGATADTGLDVAVTGQVAIAVDFTDYLSTRLPWFLGAVLGLSFLLLMAVFRSVLVPLKAVVMNLLSIGAAYGIVVAVFQWGWLADVVDSQAAPIAPFVPMMLFAIVFGLSMDYEVFLLSRIREEWDRTGDSRESVADGLAATARVIGAAAAIMVVVFGSFIGEADRVIKLFGVGLGMAILIDATVVRLLLVPATMELLGDWNWWLPRWLDRIVPVVHIEAPSDPDTEPGVDRPASR